jgi:nickel-dependent lactate racemase
VVITTNSGYPLDQNLYQTVKGLSAAARIVQPGGTILAVSECADGVPAHGKFFDLMKTGQTPDDILAAIRQFPAPVLDQWEAQILAQILKKARVFLFSSLDPQQVRLCKLQPLQNLEEDVRRILSKLPPGEAVAVLPYGPLTVPAPHKPNQMETQP